MVTRRMPIARVPLLSHPCRVLHNRTVTTARSRATHRVALSLCHHDLNIGVLKADVEGRSRPMLNKRWRSWS